MSRRKSGEKNKGGESRQRDRVSKVMKGRVGETSGQDRNEISFRRLLQ